LTVQPGPEPSSPAQGIWRAYFEAYGGLSSLVRSKYFWAAVAFTVISFDRWSQPNWWDEPLGVVPDMLGFSLGGYAVLLAFGDATFRDTLAGASPKGVSPFIVMNATFVHFIVIQGLSLLLAVLCKNTYFAITDYGLAADSGMTLLVVSLSAARYLFLGVGYGLFLYSVFLALAATMAVFRIARLYDYMVTAKRKRQPPPPLPKLPDPPSDFL
jgi:hypothetical protein